MADYLKMLATITQESNVDLRQSLKETNKKSDDEKWNEELAETAELNAQPEQDNKKPTMREVADGARVLVDFLKLGADAHETGLLNSIASKLERVQANSFTDHGLVDRAISELKDLAKSSPELDVRAKQALEHDQVSMAKMHRDTSALPPQLKEIVKKAIGEDVVNDPKKEADKKAEADATADSASPSRGMSPRAGG